MLARTALIFVNFSPSSELFQDLMKIRVLNVKSIAVIAKALESMGVIGDAKKWLSREGRENLWLRPIFHGFCGLPERLGLR
jgi:hypothetical protein